MRRAARDLRTRERKRLLRGPRREALVPYVAPPPPPPVAEPVNITPPSISPTTGLVEGTVLTASVGAWSGSPDFGYQWRRIRNGATTPIGANAPSYTITATDLSIQAGDTRINCLVAASNAGGTVTAVSPNVTPSTAPVQEPTTEPTIAPKLTSTTRIKSDSKWFASGMQNPGTGVVAPTSLRLTSTRPLASTTRWVPSGIYDPGTGVVTPTFQPIQSTTSVKSTTLWRAAGVA